MELTKLLSLAILVTSSIAANSSSYATFVYNSTYGGSLVWSINAVQSSGDVFFHLEAPYSGSWIAVGFGGQMAGSLMIVAYPNTSSTGITVAPRIATGHVEPSYTTDRKIELVSDNSLRTPNQIDKGVMYVDGVCRNCTTWNGGSLDLKEKNAPFIFAGGPFDYLADDSQEAPLKRHAFFGQFTMDMTAATSPSEGSVPNPSNSTYTTAHASSNTTVTNDNHWRSTAHAALMIISWIVIFPVGALILRVFNTVILHAIVQCVGLLFVIIAFALGITASRQYNRSNSFKSAHQIIGILLTAGLLAQLGLGIVGHRIFKRTNQPTKLAKIHVILGTILIAVAVINGALGLRLAEHGWLWLRYMLLVVAAFLIFAAIRLCAGRCIKRRRNRHNQDAPAHNFPNQTFPNQSFPNQGASNHGVGPDGYHYPQPNAAAPKEPYVQSVPLTTYNHSSDSDAHLAGPAQQPRQMI